MGDGGEITIEATAVTNLLKAPATVFRIDVYASEAEAMLYAAACVALAEAMGVVTCSPALVLPAVAVGSSVRLEVAAAEGVGRRG